MNNSPETSRLQEAHAKSRILPDASARMLQLKEKIDEGRDLLFLATTTEGSLGRDMYVNRVGLLPEDVPAALEAIQEENVLVLQDLLEKAGRI